METKKEKSKEGLIAAKELKRLQTNLVRLDRFIDSHVCRLLKFDLLFVLAEFSETKPNFPLYDGHKLELYQHEHYLLYL